MASSVDQVVEFLDDLAKRSRQTAIDEVTERQAFAESLGFEGDLNAWDYPYYSEKLKQERYRISDEDLKPYFSDERVIKGLFDIVARLYQVEISTVDDGIDRWDEQVGFYQIVLSGSLCPRKQARRCLDG
jgi:oligopeptidase A